jgi:hypothetical protein
MSEGDSSSAWVDVVRSETENLGIGLDNGSESFVEFPDGDVFFLEPGLLEELLDAGCRSDREVDGI